MRVDATVFVDDAVLGRLPPVDVTSGAPTDHTARVTQTLQGNGTAPGLGSPGSSCCSDPWGGLAC